MFWFLHASISRPEVSGSPVRDRSCCVGCLPLRRSDGHLALVFAATFAQRHELLEYMSKARLVLGAGGVATVAYNVYQYERVRATFPCCSAPLGSNLAAVAPNTNVVKTAMERAKLGAPADLCAALDTIRPALLENIDARARDKQSLKAHGLHRNKESQPTQAATSGCVPTPFGAECFVEHETSIKHKTWLAVSAHEPRWVGDTELVLVWAGDAAQAPSFLDGFRNRNLLQQVLARVESAQQTGADAQR